MKYMKAKQQIKVKIVPTIFPIEYKIKYINPEPKNLNKEDYI